MEFDALTVVLTVAIAVALACVKFGKPEPDVHSLVLQEQSTPALIRNEGESVVHRSRSVPHGAPLMKQPTDRIKTLYDVWQAGAAINPSARSLMYPLQNQFAMMDVSSAFRWTVPFCSNQTLRLT